MKFSMDSCGGCRTCEIACSFHHRGEFIPSISSLKIIDNPEEPGYSVLIVEEADGQSLACDGCKDLDVPLCVEYCRESEDLKRFWRNIWDAPVKTKGLILKKSVFKYFNLE